MLPCPGCHRHVRADESSCPFCGAALALTSSGSSMSPLVALAAGLSLFACTESGDDSADGNTTTSMTETSATMGDGDGDTQDPDYSGSDYGGPPPCDALDNAIPINVGANPVDTTNNANSFDATCGSNAGSGPDQVYQFISPAAGDFHFELAGVNPDAWLLQFGNYYCDIYGNSSTCVPGNALDITMNESDIIHLILDGTAGVAGTINVTQN